jgi:cytochrome c oxidase subunit 2
MTVEMSGATGRVFALAAGQDVLHPHSPAERRIDVLWWVMLVGAAIGFAVIATLLLLGWARRNRASLPFGGGERMATGLVIGMGIGIPIVVLSALFIWSDIFVIRSTAAPNPRSTAMTVKVIGHQWWWELRYPGRNVVTANELHIPTNTRVDIEGSTDDVIHSFWVPELNRKIDMVPGKRNRILLYADHPGRFRGQCAEFCGLQHANMSLYVFADPPARFRAWLARLQQRAPAAVGADARRGQQVFMTHACADCHTIGGTSARGTVGPDLTHLASRTTLAALTLPNRPDQLANWIRDPQHYKPGNKMPGLGLSPTEVRSVVAYLETLR